MLKSTLVVKKNKVCVIKLSDLCKFKKVVVKKDALLKVDTERSPVVAWRIRKFVVYGTVDFFNFAFRENNFKK